MHTIKISKNRFLGVKKVLSIIFGSCKVLLVVSSRANMCRGAGQVYKVRAYKIEDRNAVVIEGFRLSAAEEK